MACERRERERASAGGCLAPNRASAGCRAEAGTGVYGSDPVMRRVRGRSVLVASTLLVSASMLAPLAGPVQVGAQVPVPVERVYGEFVEAISVVKIKCTKQQKLLTPKKCRQGTVSTVVAVEPLVPPPPPVVKGQPSAPGYVPAGNPGAYAVKQSSYGEPHWDYCKPFTYKINPAGMSDSFKADMDEALARFSAASGLQFVYGGETSITPYQATDWYLQTDNTQQTLIIAILDEARVPQLAGTTAGLGGTAWVQQGSKAPRFYIGAVVVDGEAPVGSGFGSQQIGPLLLHELGHVAGLLHVPDADQVMHPSLVIDGPTNYQAGDLAGLARLASFDCF